jgi:hypothetical protein
MINLVKSLTGATGLSCSSGMAKNGKIGNGAKRKTLSWNTMDETATDNRQPL